jgi:hypothetical protein
LPVPLVTVREYVLVIVGVATGFCAVVDDKAGPLHVYTLAPPPGLAVNVTDEPKHIGPPFVGAATGIGEILITALPVIVLAHKALGLAITV